MLLETTDYYLAFDHQRLVGFLAVSHVMDQMEVTNIAVLPDYQGKGVATSLLSKILNFSGTIFLEVRESNKVAQGLYDKLGFEPYHRRKNYYHNPSEDAILMRKENV